MMSAGISHFSKRSVRARMDRCFTLTLHADEDDLRRFVEDGHGLIFNNCNNSLYKSAKINIGHDGFESNAEYVHSMVFFI